MLENTMKNKFIGYWKGLFIGAGIIIGVILVLVFSLSNNETSSAEISLFWLETMGELLGIWAGVYTYYYYFKAKKEASKGYKYECEICDIKFRTFRKAIEHDKKVHKK